MSEGRGNSRLESAARTESPAPAMRLLGLLGTGLRSTLLLPVLLFGSLFAAMALLAGSALSRELLQSILETTLPLLIVSFGQSIVILSGGIDLSVGGVMSLSTAIIATQMTTNSDIAPFLIVVIVVGLIAGTVNGILIVKTRIQPFIVTLASWSVLSGIALEVLPTEGGTVAPGLTSGLSNSVLGVPKAVVITLAMLLVWAALRRSRFGLSIYAVGSNARAAELNGLPLGRTTVLIYALSGLFSALAGVYYTVLTFSGSSVAGDPFILQSVAAVVIGGTSLFGGRGGFAGTILGALSLSLIAEIVFFAGSQSYFTQLFQGLVLLVAVLVYSVVETLITRRRAAQMGG